MNLLADILSSKTRAEIFTLLFGVAQNEFHLREIQRRAKLSIGTIRQEINKLLNLDLIVTRKDGNRTYFSANISHPLYDAIHKLVLMTSGLVDILVRVLDEENIRIAFIFGSIASGKVTSESDVDLLIIGDISSRELSSKLMQTTEQIGREINYFILSDEEFLKRKSADEHFISQVMKSPKLFIVGNENELKAMG